MPGRLLGSDYGPCASCTTWLASYTYITCTLLVTGVASAANMARTHLLPWPAAGCVPQVSTVLGAALEEQRKEKEWMEGIAIWVAVAIVIAVGE